MHTQYRYYNEQPYRNKPLLATIKHKDTIKNCALHRTFLQPQYFFGITFFVLALWPRDLLT